MADLLTSDTGMQPAIVDPDARLMLRVKAGDQAAFSELVTNYQERLVSVFFHLVQDQQTAEDLAQEVFLRVYRSRHAYVATAKFSTWLFKIANNLASNSRRSRGRRREVQLNTQDSGALGPRPAEKILADKSAMMPARQFDKREMRDVVQAALMTLNDRQRMAVLLHKFEEMSYADIGLTMDLSPMAVKSLLSRARESLRERLQAYVAHGSFNIAADSEESE